jgi:hypothetical protein
VFAGLTALLLLLLMKHGFGFVDLTKSVKSFGCLSIVLVVVCALCPPVRSPLTAVCSRLKAGLKAQSGKNDGPNPTMEMPFRPGGVATGSRKRRKRLRRTQRQKPPSFPFPLLGLLSPPPPPPDQIASNRPLLAGTRVSPLFPNQPGLIRLIG